MSDSATSSSFNGVAPLTHLGVIRVEGEDAAKFIHGQLTQDFSLLGQDMARLAAFCNAKGRMQASFIGLKRPDGAILLVCSKDLLAATLKRLSMFVLRAKARLSDASAQYQLYGVAGSAMDADAAAAAPWAKREVQGSAIINLYPSMGAARQLWISPAGAAPPTGAPLSEDLWAWSEVRSGVATLTQPVFEAFVPQMLNYESVGGVNFKKGCYPGQEVVARSQFRGTLKRRATLAHAQLALAGGDEIFSKDDSSQPVGLVVQSAACPTGGYDAIVCLQTSALADGQLQVGPSDGTPLQLLALPYPLLEDI